jgi:hypothetical protein
MICAKAERYQNTRPPEIKLSGRFLNKTMGDERLFKRNNCPMLNQGTLEKREKSDFR